MKVGIHDQDPPGSAGDALILNMKVDSLPGMWERWILDAVRRWCGGAHRTGRDAPGRSV
jgi:hypothetical protein